MRLLLVTLALVLVAGCGGSEASSPPVAGEPPSRPQTTRPVETAPPPRETIAPPRETIVTPPVTVVAPATTAADKPEPTGCGDGSVVRVGTAQRSFAAVVKEKAVAYREPGAAELASFGRENVNGYPTLFGVLAKCVDDRGVGTWYRVQLPMRPNGITGWVRAAEVRLEPVTTRIVVELGARQVTLYDKGREVMRARAAIGTAATPTPTGRYYVNQRLVPTDPSGPFGPGAIGISAFSPVLTGWAQGGPIAIHGTNRPDLIGQAVSNGCIRVRNDDLVRLFERTRAGTPVLVRA
jgi:lipoprotein-anchoring transpeptidase ErfK/SrfK